MPIDPNEWLDQWEDAPDADRPSGAVGNGTRPHLDTDQPSKWKQVFERHTEGGGPFSGRNNALTALAGFLRAKRFPYEAARAFALHWNSVYCDPPMSESEVDGRIGRAWHEWTEGDLPDATPEDARAKAEAIPSDILLLTADELLALEASGSGLEWLVPNVLLKGGVHIVSAPASGAKSWWSLDLCRCLASGSRWMDLHDLPAMPVLYWDEEMGKAVVATRVRKLGFGPGLPFYYLAKNGLKIFDGAARAVVVDTLHKTGSALLVVDTVTAVYPGLQENEAAQVSKLRAYFREFTEAGATVLVLHHDRKGGAGDSETSHERMAGSRDFAAMADMAYGIDQRGGVFNLTTIKNRHLSKDDELALQFTLNDNEDKSLVTIQIIGDEEQKRRVADKAVRRVRSEIFDALASGPLTTTELCGAVKGSPNVVAMEAKTMSSEGAIVANKAGGRGGAVIYSLPPF